MVEITIPSAGHLHGRYDHAAALTFATVQMAGHCRDDLKCRRERHFRHGDGNLPHDGAASADFSADLSLKNEQSPPPSTTRAPPDAPRLRRSAIEWGRALHG